MKAAVSKIKNLVACSILFATLLLLAGCASGPVGPNCMEAKKTVIPTGKALVYLYMTKDSYNRSLTINVKLNGQLIGNITKGGCFSYMANPGNLDFTYKLDTNFIENQFSKTHKLLTINAVAGKTYYLRLFYDFEHWGLLDAEWVRDEVGANEIAHCRLMK